MPRNSSEFDSHPAGQEVSCYSLPSSQNLLLELILRQLNEGQTSTPSSFKFYFICTSPCTPRSCKYSLSVRFSSRSSACGVFPFVLLVLSCSAPLVTFSFTVLLDFLFCSESLHVKITCTNKLARLWSTCWNVLVHGMLDFGFRSMLTNRRNFLVK
jgi:hypothetical protein